MIFLSLNRTPMWERPSVPSLFALIRALSTTFAIWQEKLGNFNEEDSEADDRLDYSQQKQIARQLSERFDDLESSIKEDLSNLEDLQRSTVDLDSIRREEFFIA